MTVIHGKYNELGYVVYKGKTPIYAAGNCKLESQTYIPQKQIDSSCLTADEIQHFCQNSVDQFHQETPNSKPGKIVYIKNLNPRRVAGQTGDLPLRYNGDL